MMGKRREGKFDLRKLQLVARAENFQDEREPSFKIGDLVRMNSGGPIMLVVDFEDDQVEVAWKRKDGVVEGYRWPRVCIHRVRDAW